MSTQKVEKTAKLDLRKFNQAVRDGVRNIPGVRIYEEEILAVSSR